MDATSLVTSFVALLVSLVAIVIASMQLMQQLYATAYDLRRCSSRTMGGWARLTHRRWIRREMRFEVTFSTPRINIHPQPAYLTIENCMELQDYERYEFFEAPNFEERMQKLPRDAGDNHKPWFLSAEDASPEAKSSWLMLLEDTVFTNLLVKIHEDVSSFDFVLEGFTRPFASADRTSFLTLMTLFGVRWDNGGKERKLTGTGEFCEVSVVNNPYYGSVFAYHRHKLWDISCWKFYLESDQARLAMFNCFDLGFARIKTHDYAELRESLLGILSSETAERVVANDIDLHGLHPILSEAIPCWAYESMPKMVGFNDDFKSVFSAKFARCKLGNPQFVQALLDHEDSSNEMVSLAQWAKHYLGTFPIVAEKVYRGFEWAAQGRAIDNSLVDRNVPWTVSLESLEGIRALDSHLQALIPDFNSYIASLANQVLENVTDRKMPMEWDDAVAISERENENLLGMFIVRQQMQPLIPTSNARGRFQFTQRSNSGPVRYDPVENKRYTIIVEKLRPLLKLYASTKSETFADHAPLAEWIMVNRLIRGTLWMVHNGNAFDRSKKVTKCNLSSEWLSINPTVYIT